MFVISIITRSIIVIIIIIIICLVLVIVKVIIIGGHFERNFDILLLPFTLKFDLGHENQ